MQRRGRATTPEGPTLYLTLTLLLTLTLSTQGQAADQEGQDGEEKEGCLPDYPCTAGFVVEFGDNRIPCDREVDLEDVKREPILRLEGQDQEKIVVLMVDPDAPSADNCPQTYYLHWMALGKIEDDIVVPASDRVGYKGPAPPPNTGTHRYQILIYAVGSEDVDAITKMLAARGGFNLVDFLNGLDKVKQLASFQFLAKNNSG